MNAVVVVDKWRAKQEVLFKMWDWTKGFLRRHKRKFITVGLIAGGVYAAGKAVQWKLSELQLKDAKDYARQAKKQFHFESNQKTCAATFAHFMVTLRDKVIESLDTEEIIKIIGTRPKNKIELWEELKIVAVTRAITSVVSACSLFLFIKVQINIIAGYMYLESMEDSEEAELADMASITRGIEMDSPLSSIQKEYLNNVRLFFEEGVDEMISDIRKLVTGKRH